MTTHTCKAKHTQSVIAALLGREKSCISRELRRNQGQRGHRSKQAHSLAQARQKACANGPRVEVKTWALVEAKLKETWSAQRISSYLLVNQQPRVSHESIYADKRKGGTLASHPALPERTQEAPYRTRQEGLQPQSGFD